LPQLSTLSMTRALAFGLALAVACSSLQASDDELSEAIEHARHLSVTQAVPASQPAINALMDRLDEATPRQRVEIRLLYIRNLALQGDYDRAIDRISAVLESPLDDDQRIRALRLAANLGINVGRHEWGFTQLKAALELVPETSQELEKSRIFSLAGFVHSLVGDHERAVEYATRAVDIAERTGQASEMCSSGQRLTVAQRYAGNLDLAETAARRALEHCRQAEDQVYLGTVELELAHLALERDELEAAERWTEDGLERLRQAVWADGILTGEHLKAQLAARRGQTLEAIERAENLIRQVDERELWERKADLHRLVAEQFAERDEFDRAYQHMIAQSEARERYLNEDRARRLAILEVEFNVQRHEQELELLREQKRVAELEAESRRQQARMRWLLAGLAVFLFAVLLMLLVHVQRERRHFRRLSQIDGLTQVSNHTRFFDTARMLVEASHRSGRPLVLVIGDIDHFKQVNDEHGHIAGDRALREVARVLCKHFPGLGHVGRIGGEEFGLCLADTHLQTVVDSLGEVRRALGKIQYGGNGKPITMSFGVAELGSDETLEALRKRADEALYHAKRSGRNSVTVAEQARSD